MLYYRLVDRETREESDEFELAKSTSTDPHAVQIVVKDGANLDYETTPSYELELSVTDKVDHEHNKNLYPDDILIVRIDLEDVPTHGVLEADNHHPRPGDTVTITARVYELGDTDYVSYTFTDSAGSHGTAGVPTYQKWHRNPATETIGLTVSYLPKGGVPGADTLYLWVPPIKIVWANP